MTHPHDPQPFARIAMGQNEPDASDIANTPTTFRRVFIPLAAVALVAIGLALALPGAWELLGEGMW